MIVGLVFYEMPNNYINLAQEKMHAGLAVARPFKCDVPKDQSIGNGLFLFISVRQKDSLLAAPGNSKQ